MIVPIPCASAIVAPTAFERLSANCSAPSNNASFVRDTVTVCVAVAARLGAKVNVPEVDV
ncbi:hypothetical protein MPOCJGCO_3245 [Methylobacterium trifolii]|uniref:Uncharacterized protein n=1 Tax=Methylobacterium trifolii TaxID=1003092 RepID=A0ABQ4U0Y8_9HYPH|nr:hypothetical protein MPOCJGCO_3245 [Methylobacterium trifolii]